MGAMECRELEPLLQTYLDGEVDDSEQLDIEAHVLKCPRCRGRLEGERGFRTQLRTSAARFTAPAALRARVQASLKKERRWAGPRRLASPSVIAVMAVAACAGFVAWLSARSLIRPLLDDAIARHTHHLPVEVSGNSSRVQQWFSDKVDFNVRLPSLRNVSLQGGRLSNIRITARPTWSTAGPGHTASRCLSSTIPTRLWSSASGVTVNASRTAM